MNQGINGSPLKIGKSLRIKKILVDLLTIIFRLAEEEEKKKKEEEEAKRRIRVTIDLAGRKIVSSETSVASEEKKPQVSLCCFSVSFEFNFSSDHFQWFKTIEISQSFPRVSSTKICSSKT